LLSSAFHPQTDGQSKVANRTIAMYLRCLATDRSRSWLQWLPWAEFCYNSSFQSGLWTTLFHVVYARPPPSLMKYEAGSSRVAGVDVQLQERDEFLAQIRERLLLAQDVMRQHHDKRRRNVAFAVGEWAWLRLHHRIAAGITPSKPSKLSPRFYGPYQVLERIGEVTYHLNLPAKAKIHDIFHVGLLKKFDGTPPEDVVPLPAIQHGRVIPSPNKITRARLNRESWEILVVWKGRAASDATWEKLKEFKKAYPEVQLEDELFVEEEGNVVDSFIGKVYQRRKPTRESPT
jgi:hypothetical protein